MEYQTGPNGSVLINDLVPGVYSVSISRTLSPEEAETLTGNRVEIFLNGTLSPLKISESGSSTIQLKGGVAGGFVIKEYYYVGVPSNYFYDGYIEIYNNSTDILYADSVCVGNTKTSSSAVYGFLEFTEYAYLQHVWMVPGSGNDHPVAPA
jgi:hypothetical protein